MVSRRDRRLKKAELKFINTTGNTIYVSDIDRSIPYGTNLIQEISLDDLKKSYSFQDLVVSGAMNVIEHGGSRIEKNLLRYFKENVVDVDDTRPSPVLSGKELEVKVRGNFYDASGYGKVNRNLSFSLAQRKIKVQILPLTSQNVLNEFERVSIDRLKKPVGDNAILIDSIIPTFSDIKNIKCGYKILYTTIEGYTIPKQFVEVANSYDEIWVTSKFCQNVLYLSGVQKDVYVVSPGVSDQLYKKSKPYAFNPPLKTFVFLSVFNWHYRKGYDALLRAYNSAFSGTDDISLLILSKENQKGEIEEYISNQRQLLSDPPHVVHCNKDIPEYMMPRLYSAANAFALPTRGEGFGLPFVEASLCGLPVIATRSGGQLDFLNDDNSTLVDIDALEPVTDGRMKVHYWDNQTFPDLKTADFISRFGNAMVDVYDNYEMFQDKNVLLQKDIRSRYICGKADESAYKRLSQIWNKICPCL